MITRLKIRGKKYGKWTAIKEFDIQDGRWRWMCKCECGVKRPVYVKALKSGQSTSCGCSKKENVTGRKFGRWTAIKEYDRRDDRIRWWCRCECGVERAVYLQGLRSGGSKSCGCLARELAAKAKMTHGQGGKNATSEYLAWLDMKARCGNKNDSAYPGWGGRGIRVCKRWRHSFENFFADVGKRPSKKHSIDRYPNNDGDYEPGNWRWATAKQQANNRRSNVYLIYNGQRKTLSEWADFFGIDKGYFQWMVTNKKKTIDQILNRKKKKVGTTNSNIKASNTKS